MNFRHNNKEKVIMVIFILLILIIIIYVLLKSDIYLPRNVRYFRYLIQDIRPPEDRYKPILQEQFNFFEKGFIKTYLLHPKYFDFYDLGITSDKKILSSKYKFKGKLRLEFLAENKVVSEIIVSDLQSRTYFYDDPKGYDMAWSSEVVLTSFEIPFRGRYKKNIGLKVTVLDPDDDLFAYKDHIKLFIRVSTSP